MGAFLLSSGVDLHIAYQPDRSHWLPGLRALQYAETLDLGMWGSTTTTTTLVGPTLHYLFTPERRGSGYLGIELLDWTQELKHNGAPNAAGKTSTLAPFFGGGFRLKLGSSGFFNVGMFYSPVTLKTETATDSVESRGAIDLYLQLGLRF